jgi:DNA polymerase I-like protein with 3'-5' exonuclease and polymerase domains
MAHRFFGDTGCHIIIPVHDELVMEVPRSMTSQLPDLTYVVKACMLSCPQITVKMDVDFSIATYTWDKKHDYKKDSV